MVYVLSKVINNGIASILVVNEHGRKFLLSYEEYKKASNICEFFENRLGEVVNNKVIKNSYTIIGKFYKSKRQDIYYLIADALGNVNGYKREQVLNSNIKFTNAIVTDKYVRFKSGSIPLIVKSKKIEQSRNTVVKLGNIYTSSVGSDGYNKKFLGRRISDNKVGIVKFPIIMESLDCINEVVCFELGKLFGFDIAEASLESYDGEDCIISCYSYGDMIYGSGIVSLRNAINDIDHFKNIFGTNWLVSNYGEKARIKFIQMLMFDYMTRQQDRHISNIAFYKKSMYSLYDNGRSLFFQTKEYNDARKNVRLDVPGDIRSTLYDNEHGFTFMFLEDIVGYNEYKQYMNNNVQFNDIQKIFNKYYKDKNRANWTAKYVYSVYKILMHKKF